MTHTQAAPDMLRMPTCFGLATGPRRGPGGRVFHNIDNPKSVSHSVQFRTNPEQLQALCPTWLHVRTGSNSHRYCYLHEGNRMAGRPWL